MKRLLVAAVLLLCVVADPAENIFIPPIIVIQKELHPLFTEYMGIVSKSCTKDQIFYPDDIQVVFAPLFTAKQRVIGLCQRTEDRFILRIDLGYWALASDDEKRALVFHEMSHCVLLLDHVKDPKNYMYWSTTANLTNKVLRQQLDADIKVVCSPE